MNIYQQSRMNVGFQTIDAAAKALRCSQDILLQIENGKTPEIEMVLKMEEVYRNSYLTILWWREKRSVLAA